MNANIKKNLIKDLRGNLEKLEELERIANVAELKYDADPENGEAEKAFDQAYKNEFDAFIETSEIIQVLLEIPAKTARAMVRGKRAELMEILK